MHKVDIDKLLADPDTDWDRVSSSKNLTKEDIQKAKDKLNWFWISSKYSFNIDEVRHFADYINWDWLNLSIIGVNQTFFREFADYLDHMKVVDYLVLTKEFRRQFPSLNGRSAAILKMKHDDVCEFIDGKQWDNISQGWFIFNQDFIEKFKDKVNWHYISQGKRYTIRFYKKFAKYLDWRYITRYEVMRWKEYKIQIFAKYIDWEQVKKWTWKKNQKSFVNKFGKRLGWT